MAVCEYCGKEFDVEFERDMFEIDTRCLSYDNLKKCLCSSCAQNAIFEDNIDGIYFEECEKCGTVFDLVEDMYQLSEYCEGYLTDTWQEAGQILCFHCASEFEDDQYEVQKEMMRQEGIYVPYDDEDEYDEDEEYYDDEYVADDD